MKYIQPDYFRWILSFSFSVAESSYIIQNGPNVGQLKIFLLKKPLKSLMILQCWASKFVKWHHWFVSCVMKLEDLNQYIIPHKQSVIHHLRYISTPTCFGTELPSSGSRYIKCTQASMPGWVLLHLTGMNKILKCFTFIYSYLGMICSVLHILLSHTAAMSYTVFPLCFCL